jgi:hypothetical protein
MSRIQQLKTKCSCGATLDITASEQMTDSQLKELFVEWLGRHERCTAPLQEVGGGHPLNFLGRMGER